MPRLLYALTSGIFGMVLLIAAVALYATENSIAGPSNSRVVFLEAESWVGKQCPLFKYLDGNTTELSSGNVAIALIDRDCATCRKCLEHQTEAWRK